MGKWLGGSAGGGVGGRVGGGWMGESVLGTDVPMLCARTKFRPATFVLPDAAAARCYFMCGFAIVL